MNSINTCMALFKGMSTVDRSGPPYSIVDAELVKRDLLNELYTKKGERVMRPNFGCIVWDLLMNPNTPEPDFTDSFKSLAIAKVDTIESRIVLILFCRIL